MLVGLDRKAKNYWVLVSPVGFGGHCHWSQRPPNGIHLADSSIHFRNRSSAGADCCVFLRAMRLRGPSEPFAGSICRPVSGSAGDATGSGAGAVGRR